MLARTTLALFGLLLTAGLSPAAPVPEAKLTKALAAEWDKVWAPEFWDPVGRTKQVLALASHPKPAVEYLRCKVRPLKLSEAQAKTLIENLGSDDEKVWKPAFTELTQLDVRLAMDLPAALGLADTEHKQNRLAAIMYGIRDPDHAADGSRYRITPPNAGRPDWYVWQKKGNQDGGHAIQPTMADHVKKGFTNNYWQQQNAIEILEHLNTPAARTFIEELADGHADVPPTTRAKEAVARLKARTPADWDKLWNANWWEGGFVSVVAALRADPDRAVPFLKGKLKPLKLEKKEAEKLLDRLFSDDLKECRAALRELQYLDLRLAIPMEEVWAKTETPKQRGRLVTASWIWDGPIGIDDKWDIDGPHKDTDYTYHTGDGDFPSGCFTSTTRAGGKTRLENTLVDLMFHRWYREESAIHILDAIGTDEALAIIKDMATGHPDAAPTRAAAEVLKRRKR